MTDLFKICRYCSSKDQLQVSLFCKYATDKNLVPMIEECLQVKVSPSSGVSGYICYDCMHRIETFHDFKNKVKNIKEAPPASPRIEEKKTIRQKRPTENSVFAKSDRLKFIDDDSGSWFNMSDKFSMENGGRRSVIKSITNGKVDSDKDYNPESDSDEDVRIPNTMPVQKKSKFDMVTRSASRNLSLTQKKSAEWKNNFPNFFQDTETKPKPKRGRPKKKKVVSQTQPLSTDLFESQGDVGVFDYNTTDEEDFDLMPSIDVISKLHQKKF